MFTKYNPNPCGRNVGDCAVRAIAKALSLDWETAFAVMDELLQTVQVMVPRLYAATIIKLKEL